ncbi:MAG TPA: asparagine synthase (glutamine-hydrolyzing) [Candidatus Acidoferrales bacterium]|nr:asparagine synthase (glutamine-hydrolyzing) [Candidatus Acidoferrales bacterium]
MCGIAGIVGVRDQQEGVLAARAMMRSMARRGPDGEGLAVWGDAVFGHRRLAIFDLSPAGAQPMCSPDRRLGVVFNGAIYNFRALRGELSRRGFSFNSRTDTEVLLHGYQAWGIDGLVERLRGMFAFALWDDRRRRLYLVRDRLGVKPLVYAAREGALAFASTARALKAAGWAGEIDDGGVAEFLRWGFVTDSRCIYQGVAKVPAATIVEWSRGSIRSRTYWEPPRVDSARRYCFPDVARETERLLVDSVAARLDADVPVGVLLSGGVDSSLVCWAVAKLGADLTAYTVGVPGDPWDETAAAVQTARRLQIRHRVLELSPADGAELNELVSAYAEPFASASALAMLRVSRAVSSEAKVLLTGDGGDDLFLGYPRHRHLWLADKAAAVLPAQLCATSLKLAQRMPQVGPLRRLTSFARYVSGSLPGFESDRGALTNYRKKDLLGPRLKSMALEARPALCVNGGKLLGEFIDLERRHRFVGEYLTKIDGATMHYGLEARSPFLDQKLCEFAAALPFDVRLRHGALKAVLREIARDRIATDVARRKKRGFGVPVRRWLAGAWADRAAAELADAIASREGWIDKAQCLSELRRSARAGVVPEELWHIFVLESWLKRERSASADRGQAMTACAAEAGF